MSAGKSAKLTSAVTALANAIACNLTLDQTVLLASVLVQLSDTLNTIAAMESLCKEDEKQA